MTAEERIKLIQSVKNPPQEVIEETAKLTGEEHYAEWMHYYAERADMLVDLIAELESENKSLKNTLDKEQFFHSLCRAAYDERGQQYITLRKWARRWKMVAKLLWRLVNEIGFCDLCKYNSGRYMQQYCDICGDAENELAMFSLDSNLLKRMEKNMKGGADSERETD